jgi:hypothetical protein
VTWDATGERSYFIKAAAAVLLTGS